MASTLRTCVGCRERADRSELLRVAVVDGSVILDLAKRLPGRGAHLHPALGCLDLAERRRAFGRALRLPGRLVDTSPLRESVTLLIHSATAPSTASAPPVQSEAGREAR